jgi:enoyl-CoA hydratase
VREGVSSLRERRAPDFHGGGAQGGSTGRGSSGGHSA